MKIGVNMLTFILFYWLFIRPKDQKDELKNKRIIFCNLVLITLFLDFMFTMMVIC